MIDCIGGARCPGSRGGLGLRDERLWPAPQNREAEKKKTAWKTLTLRILSVSYGNLSLPKAGSGGNQSRPRDWLETMVAPSPNQQRRTC